MWEKSSVADHNGRLVPREELELERQSTFISFQIFKGNRWLFLEFKVGVSNFTHGVEMVRQMIHDVRFDAKTLELEVKKE